MRFPIRNIARICCPHGFVLALICCGGGPSSTNATSKEPQTPSSPPQTPSSPATAAQYGQWSTLLYTMPINPVHAALLHTGKVLIVSGSGNNPNNAFPINTTPDFEAAIWDPRTGKITTQ